METMTTPDLERDRKSAVLCYVSGRWAYFTTQRLCDQWGDDWDDVPYEHNAGRPYAPWGDYAKNPRDWNPDGTPKWTISQVAFEGPFETPDEGHTNSPYSVKSINAGAAAWLRPSRWENKGNIKPILAGTTLEDFVELVRQAGGEVYLPTTALSSAQARIAELERENAKMKEALGFNEIEQRLFDGLAALASVPPAEPASQQPELPELEAESAEEHQRRSAEMDVLAKSLRDIRRQQPVNAEPTVEQQARKAAAELAEYVTMKCDTQDVGLNVEWAVAVIVRNMQCAPCGPSQSVIEQAQKAAPEVVSNIRIHSSTSNMIGSAADRIAEYFAGWLHPDKQREFAEVYAASSKVLAKKIVEAGQREQVAVAEAARLRIELENQRNWKVEFGIWGPKIVPTLPEKLAKAEAESAHLRTQLEAVTRERDEARALIDAAREKIAWLRDDASEQQRMLKDKNVHYWVMASKVGACIEALAALGGKEQHE